MVDNNQTDINIYKFDTKAKIDKLKIFVVILIIIALFCVILVQNHISRTIHEYKAYKQYEAQIQSIEHQEKDKKEKEAKRTEEEKQAKLPKLTDARKTKYGKHL